MHSVRINIRLANDIKTHSNVPGLRQRDIGITEHLIYMRVHHDALPLGWGLEAVPGAEWLERVVDQFDGIRLLRRAEGKPDAVIRVEPELLHDRKNTGVEPGRSNVS